MMLSTSPMVSQSGNDVQKPVIACAGCRLPDPASTDKSRPLSRQISLREDESTDVGSSVSDVDAVSSSGFGSSCCTDRDMKASEREGRNQKHRLTVRARFTQAIRHRGTVLEPIEGTPVAKTEHPPLFFTPAPSTEKQNERRDNVLQVHVPRSTSCNQKPGEVSENIFSTECTNGSTCKPKPTKKTMGICDTSGCLLSPFRRRKAKAFAVQSMLATAPPSIVQDSNLPCSPNRRARNSTMEKAKRSGLPLKVQPPSEYGSVDTALDPELPAKKRLLSFDGVQSVDQSIRKLKPGFPVKKRVSPWLLEEPFPNQADDSCTNFPVMPR